MPEIVVYQLTQVFSQSCIIGYGEGYGQEGDEGHGSEKTQGHRLLAYVLTAEILGCEYDYPDIPDDLGLYPAKVGGIDVPDSVTEKSRIRLMLSAHRIHEGLGEGGSLL